MAQKRAAGASTAARSDMTELTKILPGSIVPTKASLYVPPSPEEPSTTASPTAIVRKKGKAPATPSLHTGPISNPLQTKTANDDRPMKDPQWSEIWCRIRVGCTSREIIFTENKKNNLARLFDAWSNAEKYKINKLSTLDLTLWQPPVDKGKGRVTSASQWKFLLRNKVIYKETELHEWETLEQSGMEFEEYVWAEEVKEESSSDSEVDPFFGLVTRASLKGSSSREEFAENEAEIEAGVYDLERVPSEAFDFDKPLKLAFEVSDQSTRPKAMVERHDEGTGREVMVDSWGGAEHRLSALETGSDENHGRIAVNFNDEVDLEMEVIDADEKQHGEHAVGADDDRPRSRDDSSSDSDVPDW